MKKRIVICADGTWNRPEKNLKEDHPTNVLKLARAVRPVAADGVPQQVFYDWGLGSYHDRVVAGATGSGLDKNIMDDYRYIVQNYAPGDELYFFGFSRGAYTVRSLCGLINNVGIVKRQDARLIQAAFDHYKKRGKKFAPNGSASKKFRKAYSHASRNVHFVGVWDTVGAMGVPFSVMGLFDDKDEFYDTKIGGNIGTARHAMAIDELREDFEPTIWQPRKGNVSLEQVWFAGAHTDVGGGYAPDKDGGVLSDLTLKWMVKEANAAGLTCEAHLSRSLKPRATATVHRSRRRFYRIKPAFHRPISHGKGETLIHRSVRQRWEADRSYRPKNLTRHLDNNNGDWGTLVD